MVQARVTDYYAAMPRSAADHGQRCARRPTADLDRVD
jgi:hypothetical protein